MNRLYSLPFLTVLPAACTHSPQYDPFTVDPQMIARDPVVVLAPVTSANDVGVPDSLLSLLEAVLTDSLQAAGLEVIPSVALVEIWDAILDDLEGIFDPRTGNVIPEKESVARERLADELTHQFRAGSILYPELILVYAEYADGVARWDGTSQTVAGFWAMFAEAVTAVADVLSGDDHVSGMPYGTVAALSLQVVLEDLQGTELYANWGGIEVVADDKTGERLPPDDLFRDLERMQRGISIALRPLLESLQGSLAAS